MIADLRKWSPRPLPSAGVLHGKEIRLEVLDASKHSDGLWNALKSSISNADRWKSHIEGPFDDRQQFDDYLTKVLHDDGVRPYAVVAVADGKANGVLCYRNISQQFGTIEVSQVIECTNTATKFWELKIEVVRLAFSVILISADFNETTVSYGNTCSVSLKCFPLKIRSDQHGQRAAAYKRGIG